MSTLVAYTDGSIRPNPDGPSGYGIHSYITDEDSKVKKLPKHVITNIGYIEKPFFKTMNDDTVKEVNISKIIDIYGYNKDTRTNNMAELDGVIELLNIIETNYADLFTDIDNIVLNVDSTYVLNYLDKLINDESVEHVTVNRALVLELNRLIKVLKNKGINFDIRKVQAHGTNLGNNRADLLSNMGRVLNIRNGSEKKISIFTRDEYWDYKPKRSVAFNTKTIFNYSANIITNVYKLINTADEEEIGKRGNNFSYQLFIANEGNEIINNLIAMFNDFYVTYQIPYIINLDAVFNSTVYNLLKLYGIDYIIENKTTIYKIETIDGIVLATELYPPSLSYLAEEKFIDIMETYETFKDVLDGKNDIIDYIDITDYLYDKDNKDRNILKKDIKNDKYDLTIPYDNYNVKKISLKLGLDIIKRNSLKNIEKDVNRIYLLIYKLDKMLLYYTVVDYKDGVIVTMSSANILILKE